MGVDFHDFFEVRDRVVLGAGEHLGFLDFVHEGGVTIRVSNHHTGFISESVGNDDIVDFFKQQLLSIIHQRLILLGQELLLLPLQLIIIRHLKITLTHINNILPYPNNIPSSHTPSGY